MCFLTRLKLERNENQATVSYLFPNDHQRYAIPDVPANLALSVWLRWHGRIAIVSGWLYFSFYKIPASITSRQLIFPLQPQAVCLS